MGVDIVVALSLTLVHPMHAGSRVLRYSAASDAGFPRRFSIATGTKTTGSTRTTRRSRSTRDRPSTADLAAALLDFGRRGIGDRRGMVSVRHRLSPHTFAR